MDDVFSKIDARLAGWPRCFLGAKGHADRKPASRSTEEGGGVVFRERLPRESATLAEAAAERLKAKLEEVSRRDPPIEMKFSLPDEWSVQLFIALCRRYGIRPFRYPRPGVLMWREGIGLVEKTAKAEHTGLAASFGIAIWTR